MIPNEILSWAKQFYYTSLNLPVDDAQLSNPENESTIINEYHTEFSAPVAKMSGKSSVDALSSAETAEFLTIIRSNHVPGVLHALRDIQKDFFENTDPDYKVNIDAALKKFQSTYTQYYAMYQGSSKPFQVNLTKARDVVGSYPNSVGLCVLGPVARFSRGINLHRLSQQDPTLLTDFDISALRAAVSYGIIPEGNLMKAKYVVPNDTGWFDEQYVSATSKNLPGFFVRRLISILPEATLKDAPSPYHAAYDFASEHPAEYRSALRELSDIISRVTPAERLPRQSAVELNDDMVIAYINQKYGIPEEQIRQSVLVPTTEKLYTSSYFLDEKSKDMSAADFMDMVNSNPLAGSGTLDELLEAFCKQEKFSQEHTIAELIDYVNDRPVPADVSLQARVNDYKVTHKLSEDTTLEEFVNGIPHQFVDDADVALRLIRDCDNMSDGVKNAVCDCIINETPCAFPDPVDQLASIGLPDALLAAITISLQTKRQVSLPEHITTEDEVVTYLVRAGVPRSTAKGIATGSTHGTGGRLNEPGYIAAESLLYDMRYALTTHDTDELRTNLLPIIYSYMRILMMDSKDTEEVIAYLENKRIAECTGEATEFLERAIAALQ